LKNNVYLDSHGLSLLNRIHVIMKECFDDIDLTLPSFNERDKNIVIIHGQYKAYYDLKPKYGIT
jgi:hypothetical protein